MHQQCTILQGSCRGQPCQQTRSSTPKTEYPVCLSLDCKLQCYRDSAVQPHPQALSFSTRKMGPSRQHSCATAMTAHLLLLSAICDPVCGTRDTMRKPRAVVSRQVNSAAALERYPISVAVAATTSGASKVPVMPLLVRKQAGKSGKASVLPSLRCSHHFASRSV